jgi:hypothetical protein
MADFLEKGSSIATIDAADEPLAIATAVKNTVQRRRKKENPKGGLELGAL